MRVVKSLDDVNVILKELGQWKDRLSSKNQDFKGLKIQNAGDATEPQDYVTLSQLTSVSQSISQNPQHYSIPFSVSGAATTGMLSAPFIVGKDRVGRPTLVSVAVPTVAQAPSGSDLLVNLQINGINLLANNLDLPIGNAGPISSSAFVSPLPILSVGSKITPVIVSSDGIVSFVTIQLYIERIMPNS